VLVDFLEGDPDRPIVTGIQAEKTQTTKVKGSQGITVDGSRSVSVGGDQSTTVTKNETQTYKADRKMDVTGTDTNTITGAHSGTYKAGRTQTVSGQDDVLNVALNRTSTITGQYHIQADAEFKVTHKDNVVLLRGTKTQMTNGKCTLTLDGGRSSWRLPRASRSSAVHPRSPFRRRTLPWPASKSESPVAPRARSLSTRREHRW
jgi:type VI secretion system secreted protein VgrG